MRDIKAGQQVWSKVLSRAGVLVEVKKNHSVPDRTHRVKIEGMGITFHRRDELVVLEHEVRMRLAS